MVLAAPKDGGTVEMLCFRPAFNKRDFVESLTLTKAHGVPGERWEKAPWLRLADGRPHPGIQVSILPRRVLDLVWRDRANTPHPGDTFICDLDMTEANLPEGQLLQIGEAVLRVSDVFNDGCVKWKARYGKPAYDWVRAPENRPLRLRGVLCSIESDGIIRNGDRLTVLR
ncbi:MOSC domain-containing protein [Neogemmobacter tilapiae]|nr:hypothetical protein [Gemmobacter tilapiae]